MEIITSIKSVKDWKRVYPLAGKDKQWKDGYSAKEFAKIVLDAYPDDNNFETDLANKLHLGNDFQLIPEEIYPERLTNFDDNYRGPRHHDLACIAKKGNKRIALCFEAKVNESLDKPLNKYRDSDGKINRVDSILKNFFNKEYTDREFGNIYYQILSAIAGSIAFAAENNVPVVYFILYQIKPLEVNPATNCEKNKNALEAFINLFGNRVKKITENIFDLGNLSIERGFEGNPSEKMNANVKIAYIEKEVSGKKVKE